MYCRSFVDQLQYFKKVDAKQGLKILCLGEPDIPLIQSGIIACSCLFRGSYYIYKHSTLNIQRMKRKKEI